MKRTTTTAATLALLLASLALAAQSSPTAVNQLTSKLLKSSAPTCSLTLYPSIVGPTYQRADTIVMQLRCAPVAHAALTCSLWARGAYGATATTPGAAGAWTGIALLDSGNTTVKLPSPYGLYDYLQLKLELISGDSTRVTLTPKYVGYSYELITPEPTQNSSFFAGPAYLAGPVLAGAALSGRDSVHGTGWRTSEWSYIQGGGDTVYCIERDENDPSWQHCDTVLLLASTDSTCHTWHTCNHGHKLNLAYPFYPDVFRTSTAGHDTFWMICNSTNDGQSSIYLYSSTTLDTWRIRNGGNPIIVHSGDTGHWTYNLWDGSLRRFGSTWVIFVSGDGPASPNGLLGLSVATSTDTVPTFNSAWWQIGGQFHYPIAYNNGDPWETAIPDRNAVLLITSDNKPGARHANTCPLTISWASLADDITQAASWHSAPWVQQQDTCNLSDPAMLFCSDTFHKFHSLLGYRWNQLNYYQEESPLSLDEFFDAVVAGANVQAQGRTYSVSAYQATTDTAGQVVSDSASLGITDVSQLAVAETVMVRAGGAACCSLSLRHALYADSTYTGCDTLQLARLWRPGATVTAVDLSSVGAGGAADDVILEDGTTVVATLTGYDKSAEIAALPSHRWLVVHSN